MNSGPSAMDPELALFLLPGAENCHRDWVEGHPALVQPFHPVQQFSLYSLGATHERSISWIDRSSSELREGTKAVNVCSRLIPGQCHGPVGLAVEDGRWRPPVSCRLALTSCPGSPSPGRSASPHVASVFAASFHGYMTE